MRRILVTMWMSLDGYISGPNGEMDWVTNIFTPQMGAYEDEIVSAADTLILGRITYESFAGSWPKVPDNPSVSEEEKAYAGKLNAMKKIVFSKTMQTADWNNSKIHHDIDPEAIQALKEEDGKDMLLYGSASIIRQFTNLNLIDEYQLLVHPYILGNGKSLFSGINGRKSLELVETKEFPAGVVILKYRSFQERK